NNTAYLSAAAVGNNGGLYDNNSHLQPFPTPQFEFSFTPPQAATPSNACLDPYMSNDGSPMLMPLNPNFPIAEFSSTMSQHQQHQQHSAHAMHARSLSNMSAGLTLEASAFVNSLSMIDTSALTSFSVADSMPINAFSAGYLSAETLTAPMVSSANPWPLQQQQQHAYTLLPDTSASSLDHQNNHLH
ncbi:hypothetical protein IWW38_005073, partial [Coemansia aciculifera]